jgi:hypothetical protein
MRRPLRAVFRGLHKAESAEGPELRKALAGDGEHLHGPELAARCVRVLGGLGLCEWRTNGGAPVLRVLSSERTELGRSRAYAACVARHQEATTYLQSRAPSG